MTPQANLVLMHLKRHGSMSSVEAAAVYRIRHLPRRILDIIEAGHTIIKEQRKDPTGQRYVRYFLENKADA